MPIEPGTTSFNRFSKRALRSIHCFTSSSRRRSFSSADISAGDFDRFVNLIGASCGSVVAVSAGIAGVVVVAMDIAAAAAVDDADDDDDDDCPVCDMMTMVAVWRTGMETSPVEPGRSSSAPEEWPLFASVSSAMGAVTTSGNGVDRIVDILRPDLIWYSINVVKSRADIELASLDIVEEELDVLDAVEPPPATVTVEEDDDPLPVGVLARDPFGAVVDSDEEGRV